MARNHKTFFVVGFLAVLTSGIFFYRFRPTVADESTPPETRVTRPATTPATDGDLKRHGLYFERIQKGLPKHGQWRGSPAVGDFNRDGNLDLVCSNRKGDGLHVFLGDGRGGFTDHSEGFNRLLGYGGAAVADVNEDGIPDVLFSTHRVPMVCYTYDGKGVWTESSKGFNNKNIFHDVATADFDGDGHADVVGLGLFGGGLEVYQGDGEGTWSRTAHDPMTQKKFGREVLAVDVDEDGRTDIVATHIGIRCLINRGGFRFEDASTGLPRPETIGTFSSVAAANVDGRKGLEIAAASIAIEGNRGLAVYTRGPHGRWSEIVEGLPAGRTFGAVAFADMNGDGHPDLVAGSEEAGILIFLGDGAGRWTNAGTIPETRLHKMTFATGDFDKDGRTDLVVVYPDNPGGVILFLNRAVAP